jgi:hypothetical protein
MTAGPMKYLINVEGSLRTSFHKNLMRPSSLGNIDRIYSGHTEKI